MSKITVEVKPIKPGPFHKGPYRDELNKALREEGAKIKTQLILPTKKWSKKPSFRKKVRLVMREASVKVTTEDKRYRYLDKGTKKRWAVMSSDFKPKTTPRTLGSRRGQGKAVIRGKQAMQARGIKPRPGIQPREFTDEAAKRRKPWFEKRIDKAIARAAKQSF